MQNLLNFTRNSAVVFNDGIIEKETLKKTVIYKYLIKIQYICKQYPESRAQYNCAVNFQGIACCI